MKTINVFVENYKSTTSGLNVYAKVVVALFVALIALSIVSAFANVILYGF